MLSKSYTHLTCPCSIKDVASTSIIVEYDLAAFTPTSNLRQGTLGPGICVGVISLAEKMIYLGKSVPPFFMYSLLVSSQRGRRVSLIDTCPFFKSFAF